MITDEQAVELVRSGYFRVDVDGSVWRCMVGTRTGNRRRVDPTRADYIENNGYRRIRFGKRSTITAHRLVWLAFRGPIPVGFEINHKNLDKGDNRIDNLELLTHEANVHHALAAGVVPPNRGESNGQSKLTEARVLTIRGLIAAGIPRRRIARLFGVSHVAINHIAARRSWRHVA